MEVWASPRSNQIEDSCRRKNCDHSAQFANFTLNKPHYVATFLTSTVGLMNCYFPVGGLATERTHSLERTQLERLKEDLQGKISGELDLNFVEAFAQKMLTPYFRSSGVQMLESIIPMQTCRTGPTSGEFGSFNSLSDGMRLYVSTQARMTISIYLSFFSSQHC